MALAYGAVLTLIDLINLIPAHHTRRPTSFSMKQLEEIESIKEKACFIQGFLEAHSLGLEDSSEAQDLKGRIMEVSKEAAYVIETLILDDIYASSSEMKKKVHLYHVLHFMDCIVKEMVEFEDLQPNKLIPTHSSSITHPTMFDPVTHVVGFDDRSIQIMDKLTREQPAFQVIPITGMGGIGKTTLAQTIYDNSLIVESFDIRAWVTISQVYNIEQVLLNLFRGFGIVDQENSEYHDLGQILHKHLFGRKYLIIVDDLWNTEAWDKLRRYLPDTKGSRIIVTTRLNEVANCVGSSNNLHELNFLNENESWRLLCHKIFGKENCPILELEKVGKEIARSCEGLPLSIVVMGGLLAKSAMTLDSWKYVAGNVNKIINSENSDCSDILLLSYNHLPIQLRPCFLYVRVFPEDHDICVSELLNMWVAEGFIKPNKLKIMEDVAEEYLMDLRERHLIMISEWTSLGTMKTCKVHDLLRDLCLREAAKEGSISVNETISSLQGYVSPSDLNDIPHVRYVRVLGQDIYLTTTDEGYSNLLKVRFLRISFIANPETFSLLHRLWNLQTLVLPSVRGNLKTLTLPIWKMPHLRHLIVPPLFRYISLDIPLPGDSVLENLQTLDGVYVKFEHFEEIFSRIPNVKVLRMRCDTTHSGEHFKSYGHLLKLQSLTLYLYGDGEEEFISKSVFPDSLKKLELIWPGCSLDEISKRIGCLPHLEKLTLRYAYNMEEYRDWNPVEGQFLQLRVLKLEEFSNLVNWNAESVHFPVLEHLRLKEMYNLEEIPNGIGEIVTLQSITLRGCKDSVVESAKEILEYQKSIGNEEDFRLTIRPRGSY